MAADAAPPVAGQLANYSDLKRIVWGSGGLASELCPNLNSCSSVAGRTETNETMDGVGGEGALPPRWKRTQTLLYLYLTINNSDLLISISSYLSAAKFLSARSPGEKLLSRST